MEFNIYEVEGILEGGIEISLNVHANEFIIIDGIALFYSNHELIVSVPADRVLITKYHEEETKK